MIRVERESLLSLEKVYPFLTKQFLRHHTLSSGALEGEGTGTSPSSTPCAWGIGPREFEVVFRIVEVGRRQVSSNLRGGEEVHCLFLGRFVIFSTRFGHPPSGGPMCRTLPQVKRRRTSS